MNPGSLAHYKRKTHLERWRQRIERTYQEQAQQNGLLALEKGMYGDEFFVDDDGYDLDGYDAEGYNRWGINRSCYTREDVYMSIDAAFEFTMTQAREHWQAQWKVALDSPDGRDDEGYDVAGYDEEGYDRHGIDEDGYNREGKYLGRDLWDFDNLNC